MTDGNRCRVGLGRRTVDVVAGTGWLFARPEIDGAFDILFVDEAGQMSLANAVASGRTARSIVLLGDPNQLPMVSQGVHPEGAASRHWNTSRAARTRCDRRAASSYETWRMHPAVNAYMSDSSTTGGSRAEPTTALRGSRPRPCPAGAGLRWLPTRAHRQLVLGRGSRRGRRRHGRRTDRETAGQDVDGRALPITGIDDIIVVAPYNAQVAEIQAASSDGPACGHGSGRSTSSRAKKEPWRSTRWRVRARRTRRGTWTSCTAGTA